MWEIRAFFPESFPAFSKFSDERTFPYRDPANTNRNRNLPSSEQEHDVPAPNLSEATKDKLKKTQEKNQSSLTCCHTCNVM